MSIRDTVTTGQPLDAPESPSGDLEPGVEHDFAQDIFDALGTAVALAESEGYSLADLVGALVLSGQAVGLELPTKSEMARAYANVLAVLNTPVVEVDPGTDEGNV